MKDKRLVIVEWIDSSGIVSSWVHVDDIENDLDLMVSVGWLLAESEKCITIVPHYDAENKKCDGVFTIPCVAVKSIRDLIVDEANIQKTSPRPGMTPPGQHGAFQNGDLRMER